MIFPKPLRRWQLIALWIWGLFPVWGVLAFGRFYLFDWTSSNESEYVSMALKVYLVRSQDNLPKFSDSPVGPLVPSAAQCQPWLPQEIWRNCIAVTLSRKLIEIGGVDLLLSSLSSACESIDWLERFGERKNEIRHGNLYVNYAHARPDFIRGMRSYFRCGRPHDHTDYVYVYVNGVNGEFLGKRSFKR
jgi:hypothetical protein